MTRLGVVCCGLIITVTAATADGNDPAKPPSIEYGNSRSSQTWIETGRGQVAVDEGIEWEGVKVYLSLTWTLVGVDAKTNKTLWAENISAFYNAMAIKEVEIERGKKTWAIELRPRSRDPQTNKLVALHDLKTGKKIDIPGQVEKPSGTALQPRKSASGQQCQFDKPTRLLVSTAENWEKVRTRMFQGLDKVEAPSAKDIDFSKEIVLVVADGNSTNSLGIEVAEAYEDEKRVLIRLHRRSVQTEGGGISTKPFGVFVLPRRMNKPYVLERNQQRYIGGPPIWKEQFRFEKIGDAVKELDNLP